MDIKSERDTIITNSGDVTINNGVDENNLKEIMRDVVAEQNELKLLDKDEFTTKINEIIKDKKIYISNLDEKLSVLINAYNSLVENHNKSRKKTINTTEEFDKLLKQADFVGAEKLLEANLNYKVMDLANDYNNLGNLKLLNFNYEEAYKHLREAVRLESDNEKYLNDAGKICKEYAKFDEALNFYKKRLTILEQNSENNHKEIALCLLQIGQCYKELADINTAFEYFNKALLCKDPFITSTCYNSLGLTYIKQKEFDKALECFRKIEEIWEKEFNMEKPLFPGFYNNLGMIYSELGLIDDAYYNYCIALKVNETLYGEDHPQTAYSYNNVGAVFSKKAKRDNEIESYNKALEYHYKALNIRKEKLGESHPLTESSYKHIRGNYDEIKNLIDLCLKQNEIEKAYSILEKIDKKNSPPIGESYLMIGMSYKAKGLRKKAKDCITKGFEICEKGLGTEYPHLKEQIKLIVKTL